MSYVSEAIDGVTVTSHPSDNIFYGVWSGFIAILPPASVQDQKNLWDKMNKSFGASGFGLGSLQIVAAYSLADKEMSINTYNAIQGTGIATSVISMYCTEMLRGLKDSEDGNGGNVNLRYAMDMAVSTIGVIGSAVGILANSGYRNNTIKTMDTVLLLVACQL